jgi:hypothetical protein
VHRILTIGRALRRRSGDSRDLRQEIRRRDLVIVLIAEEAEFAQLARIGTRVSSTNGAKLDFIVIASTSFVVPLMVPSARDRVSTYPRRLGIAQIPLTLQRRGSAHSKATARPV